MSSTTDFACVFCNETFENKEILQEHFRKHADPNFNSSSKTKIRLQNEQATGEKSEDGEMVGCDVCDETFPSISKAITHKHKVHPDHDAKHFCPWCGKLFTMKHLYNKHMQSMHNSMVKTDDDPNYHCDCCEVDFYVPSAMVYHNKFFHRQDTKLPAIGHSKKVKTVNQELLNIYYCPFCGEEYNNKVNLHKHMGDDHSDENQSPDEILRCPLCEAVFYHLDAYELHLSFHSTEDVYKDENETALNVTDFSLESVPPIMEKVEEESKNPEPSSIDTFLQLVMDDSRESGNTDNNDRPKSKKHKKHKKSKKAAITLDEFLNMNKDVFGDGLDVQGIEEVPTQQVLKKIKGKNVKPIPTSAIAKLKKQGITIKSKGPTNIKPMLKTNLNLTVNTSKVLTNNVPFKVQEKPSTTVTSNELLSKLLNQGNSQIKIVKRSAEENSTKEKNIQQDNEKLTIKSLTPNKLLPHKSDTEEENENKASEISQVTDDIDSEIVKHTGDSQSEDKNNEEETNSDEKNKSIEKNNLSHNSNSTTVNKEINNHIIGFKNDVKAESSDDPEINTESSGAFQKTNENATDMSDKDDSFETNEDVEANVSDELIPEDTEMEPNPEVTDDHPQENSTNVHRSLNALKHLSGFITVKSAQNTEDKNDNTQISSEKHGEEESDSIPTSNFKILNKNLQNVALKKTIGQIKPIPQTKSVDSLKNLSGQLTIKPRPSVNSSKIDEENENNESDDDLHDDIPFNNTIDEEDNVTFKTPMSGIKQTIIKKPIQVKTPVKETIKEEDNTKKSFNMDILKRLTNVTAKPVARPANNIPLSRPIVKNANTSGSFIQKEKNKVIDQDIEIFNIDDSDDDQEAPNEETVPKQVNVSKSTENKASASTDVLKNLSKNITIKPPTALINKNNLNVKKDTQSEKFTTDKKIHSPKGNDSKINFQKKQLNMNLNHTLKKLGSNISIKSQYSSSNSQSYQMQHDDDDDDDDDMDDHFDMNDEESDTESSSKVKISEVQDDEDLPSDIDTEYNENVIVQSPQGTYSENEEEHQNNHSDDEASDIEGKIKINTLTKEKSSSNACLDNFKRNNRELTIKSLNEKNTDFPQVGSPSNKKEEGPRPTKNPMKETPVKNENEVAANKVNQSAASSSATQKVTNQVNTVKTVKTFQSETIIEEITTTVTKTIRTVNQSSKQVAQNANVNTYRPRLMIPNQQVRPIQGMTVRNAQTVGTKIRNAAPSPRPTIAMPSRPQGGQLVPVRPQNQIVARQGVFRASPPGPSNIRKMSPQSNVQKPVLGKPLKISPLAINQSVKRPSEDMTGHFSCFKKPKDSLLASLDTFDDDFDDDSTINYSSAACSRSDFSTTATKMVKGKAVVTATQARSEQHSEQHITKLNNVSGLKIVRKSAKQASQIETKAENVGTAKRTTLDAIEKLQKQGLLIKKPRIETPEETEQYHSESDDDFDDK